MFQGVDYWDWALWAVAAYVAVVTLVRLMAVHRDRLVAQFRAQMELERRGRSQFAPARKRPEAPAKKSVGGRNTAA